MAERSGLATEQDHAAIDATDGGASVRPGSDTGPPVEHQKPRTTTLHTMELEDDVTWKFVDAQSRLVTQASDFSLSTISSMVDNGALDPSPYYQRRQRWGAQKQSALIESFLLNVPVPPVYLAEEDYGAYSVIDGQQRITAIHEFMRGNLRLTGLAELRELNYLTIRDLPDVMVNALRVRPYIRAVTLLRQTNPELKFEVFIRLNRGGESLNDQEVRHVAFRGPLNDLIVDLSEHPFLQRQFNITRDSERYRQMRDAEYVLRFLTLLDVWPSFSGELSPTMDHFMLRHLNLSGVDLQRLSITFTEALTACESIWGSAAFCRAENESWRGRAILGMYDAEMLAVAMATPQVLNAAIQSSDEVARLTMRLFDDSDFVRAVTVSTNTSARLRYRVERVAEVLASVA